MGLSLFKKKQNTNGCLNRLPNYLYRYYSLDEKYNKSQLDGCLYFSSPLKFNDLFDAQHEIVNNINDVGVNLKKVKRRLLEIGYTNPDEVVETLKNSNQAERIKMEIRKRQLEKVGVCCFINDPLSILMWAYYNKNKGFCIEYDVREIERQLVRLFAEYLEKDEKFVLNRISADAVKYQHSIPASSLFFNENKPEKIVDKYFYKAKCWEHEHEYRIVLSLGGNALLSFKNIVKSITFGYNMPKSEIINILSIISKIDGSEEPKLYFLNKIRGLDALERVQYIISDDWASNINDVLRDVERIRNL